MDKLGERTVTTRKPHRCAWCPEPIEAHQQAVTRAYIWEGDFHHEYLHPECFEAMEASDIEDGFDLQSQKRGQAINYYGDPIPTQATA